MSLIYENPVETEVDLIARITSVCENIKKYTIYMCACMHQTECVTSNITVKSQATSSTAFVNNSKILPLKYTIEIREIYLQ